MIVVAIVSNAVGWTISPVVLEFDLKLIARKTFSTASYTEKYALQHTESPKESSEGKAWKMSHTVSTVDPHISKGNGTDPTSYMLKIRI